MKKLIILLTYWTIFLVGNAVAMEQSKMEGMDHSQMDHGAVQNGGTFKNAVMVDGIHAEFQIMELAAMNMSDPEGRTHHVMVTFMKDGQPIGEIAGKVKLIAPSGKEQVATLKGFGSGVFAANFAIDEQGKWGVISLFKDMAGKHTVKFWYPHGM